MSLDADTATIAPLFSLYWDWLMGHGGASPEDILKTPLSPTQRKQLLELMEDCSVLYSMTAPLRREAHVRQRRAALAANPNWTPQRP